MGLFNLKNVNPVGGVGDFIEHWKQPTPYRWQILGLAMAMTFAMLVVFAPKTERAPPAKPQVIWINSWRADRSEKEIVASNIANQKRKDAAAVEQKQREEFRKEFYRKLARASGMDPDALARQYGQQPAPPPPSAKPAGSPAK